MRGKSRGHLQGKTHMKGDNYGVCGPVKAVVVATMVDVPARWPILWHMMARAGW